jgi:intron-binding protein aquarius
MIDVTMLQPLLIFRITFPEESEEEQENIDKDKLAEIVVEPFVTPNRGPYPYNQPKR